jgi:hypothetical protein
MYVRLFIRSHDRSRWRQREGRKVIDGAMHPIAAGLLLAYCWPVQRGRYDTAIACTSVWDGWQQQALADGDEHEQTRHTCCVRRAATANYATVLASCGSSSSCVCDPVGVGRRRRSMIHPSIHGWRRSVHPCPPQLLTCRFIPFQPALLLRPSVLEHSQSAYMQGSDTTLSSLRSIGRRSIEFHACPAQWSLIQEAPAIIIGIACSVASLSLHRAAAAAASGCWLMQQLIS